MHPQGRREFVAPLRALANEQLSRWSEQVGSDPQQIARAGWKRLLTDYAADPKRHLEILSAISRFRLERNPLAKSELDQLSPESADQLKAIHAFKNAARPE
jgi:hypothetical protein